MITFNLNVADIYVEHDDFLQNRALFADKELAESISKVGLLQPIVVQIKDGKYRIISGRRRYAASKLLGLEKIECTSLQDEDVDEIARIDSNIYCKPLTEIETRIAHYKRIQLIVNSRKEVDS